MILEGDSLYRLKEVDDNSIGQLVTDPPYGIEFMGKDWDKAIPSIDIWKECLRVMKPGAFGFILCIPRQDCLSRMMISLEDAGFNINFTSLYWTYATGFPKATHVGKAIDKRLKKERKVVGKNPHIAYGRESMINYEIKKENAGVLTAPASDEAKKMEGSYCGFQPKPAVEVVIVVMKPLSEGSYLNQAMKDGKGVVWFDDCRIPYKDEDEFSQVNKMAEGIKKYKPHNDSSCKIQQLTYDRDWNPTIKGRFPANLLVSDDILDDGKNHQSGTNKSINENSNDLNYKSEEGFHNMKINSSAFYFDSGGYSRYFSLDAWAEKNLPFLITPKASKKEKNAGCGNLNDKPRPVMIDQNIMGGYNPIRKNNHPTVKPMQLKSYLITMGSREGDTILDPFAGSFTTHCAAVILNRKCISIEKDPEYVKIGRARVKYWSSQPLKF